MLHRIFRLIIVNVAPRNIRVKRKIMPCPMWLSKFDFDIQYKKKLLSTQANTILRIR